MRDLIAWYVALMAIGMGSLLPAMVLFERLRSGGVLYARPLGLLCIAVGAWVVTAATPVPYGLGLILVMLAALWLWSLWLGWRQPAMLDAVADRWRILLAGEAVFFALFALIVLVRAQAPAASATEKPMDLMLLTSIRAADSLPASDAWFAGHELSYYHLGHVMVDIVGRLSEVAPAVEFNIGIAMAGALAGAAIFALAGDILALSPLRRPSSPWVAGGLGVAALLFVSTEVGFIDLLGAHGIGRDLWPRLGVAGVPTPQSTETGVPTEFWWWWHATRIIPGTITEFPTFSIVLGDLHAHVLALPLGILAIAVTLPAFEGMTALSWRSWLRRPGALFLAGTLFAALVMTNPWDAAVYGVLWGLAATVAFLGAGWRPLPALLLAARYILPPAALALLLTLSFFTTLDMPSLGVDLLTTETSDPARFILVWLPLGFPLLAAASLLRLRVPVRIYAFGVAAGLLSVLVAVIAAMASDQRGALGDRGAGWLLLGALVLSIGWASAATWGARRDGDRARAAWLGLLTLGMAILLLLELVYVKDELGGRLNSVFKFWYAIWVLFAVAGAVALAMVYDRLPKLEPRRLSVPLAAVLLVVSGGTLLYGPAAAVARAREGQQQGLNSLSYLGADRGLASAIEWVRSNLDSDDVLLEAVGADYGGGNIVSAATGVPTLLAWPGHEIQWRGKIPAIRERQAVVARIYQQGPTEDVRALAIRYGVTHVYLGREEQVQFGNDVAARFAAWPMVFEAPGVRIVAVPQAPQ